MAVYVQVRMPVHMWQKRRTELLAGGKIAILLILSSENQKMMVTGSSGNH